MQLIVSEWRNLVIDFFKINNFLYLALTILLIKIYF